MIRIKFSQEGGDNISRTISFKYLIGPKNSRFQVTAAKHQLLFFDKTGISK